MKNNNIILPIKIYNNKIPGYCLIGTYLTVRNTYEKNFNSAKEEEFLYQKLKNKASTLDLIQLLNKHEYHVKIFSEKDYRTLTKEKSKISTLAKNYVKLLNKLNIYEKTGVSPTSDLIKNCLEKKDLLLVNGIKNKTPHMRIIFGYKNGKFLIADPSYKKHSEIPFSSLKKLLKAPFGFWMVATKPLK